MQTPQTNAYLCEKNLSSMTGTEGVALREILTSIHKGETQLPDFQRGWVWDDRRIQTLIASLTNNYPIGAAMFLDNTNENIRFKFRVIEGVDIQGITPPQPRYLILDGQQRFTSIYRAIFSKKPVETTDGKGKKIKRYYYLHIPTCLNTSTNRINGIVSVPETRIVMENIGRDIKLDLSTREKEFEQHYFPLNVVFDTDALMNWQMGYWEYSYSNPNIAKQWTAFYKKIISAIVNYRIPLIMLPASTSKEAVCQVFENVNQGGVHLTIFELVTAMFAADGFQLRDDWDTIVREVMNGNRLLHYKGGGLSYWGENFLTAITLLANYYKYVSGEKKGLSCKREDVLDLKLKDYERYRDALIDGINESVKLLEERCGIFTAEDLPYTSQLIPLSVLFAIDKNLWFDEPNKRKLCRWYWCGVFGELYGGANESRYPLDVVGMIQWANGSDKLPDTIERSTFNYSRLQRLYTRNSAAYKGVMGLILKNVPKDWLSGGGMDFAAYKNEMTDIHHIFPQRYCTKSKLPIEKWNSVINKTPLYARTNRFLGGDAPSRYTVRIENKDIVSADLDEWYSSHAINPIHLRADDFNAFYEYRANLLCDMIEAATGKPVDGRDVTELQDDEEAREEAREMDVTD